MPSRITLLKHLQDQYSQLDYVDKRSGAATLQDGYFASQENKQTWV
jgi:hypothetical protein